MDKKVITLIKNHKTLERAIKKITKMEKQDLVLIKIRQVQTSSQVSHKQDKIRLLKVF